MKVQNNLPNQKQFSFKLTKIAGIVCSSMLIFSAFNIAQAQDAGAGSKKSEVEIGDSFSDGPGSIGIYDTEKKKVLLATQANLNQYKSKIQLAESGLQTQLARVNEYESLVTQMTDNDPKLVKLNADMDGVKDKLTATLDKLKLSRQQLTDMNTKLLTLDDRMDTSREEIAIARTNIEKALNDARFAENEANRIAALANDIKGDLAEAVNKANVAEQKASDFEDTDGDIIVGLLKELKDKLKANKDNQDTAKDIADGATSRAQAANIKVGLASSIAESANTKVETLEKDLGVVEGDSTSSKESVGRAQTDVVDLTNRITTVEGKAENTEQSINNLQDEVTNDLNPLLTTVESKADQAKVEADEAQKVAKENKDGLKELDDKIIETAAEIVRVDNELTATKEKVVEIDEELDTQKTRFGDLETRTNDIEAELTKITEGNAKLEINDGERTAKLTVTNADGRSHGLEITGTKTRLTGGTRSSSLTLDDKGATFGHQTTGKPIKVTGIADGRSDFDAVNFRQLDKVSKGVAMSMAMDGIPQAFNGRGSIGLGVARFSGHNALALGASYHDDEYGLTYNIKVSQSGEKSKEKINAGSAGIGWEWF